MILGIKIVIENRERLLQNQPCIYLGNHQSNLDIIIHAFAYQKSTVAIGKKEIIFIPVFGTLFYLAGNILLDRQNKNNAFASLDKACAHIIKNKVSIYMFPEGTRNHGAKELLPFKRGAFYLAIKAQVPLVPIVASPIYPLLDFKNKRFKKGTITLTAAEPIITKGKSENDIQEIMTKAQNRMQNIFNESKTVVG
jgi:1-acyl-sn-glycerol-3-phosphate acyltransferase